MNVDMPTKEQEQQNQGKRNLKDAQLKKPEGVERANGTVTNQETIVEIEESQTTVSDHRKEGTVEDVTGWLEWYVEV
jgi:hypothetical protein